jgi:hypothetical protein
MWKTLKAHLPAVLASAAFTGAVLGGYIWHLRTAVIPALQAEQRAHDALESKPMVAASEVGAAAQRQLAVASTLFAQSLLLMQTTQAMLPMLSVPSSRPGTTVAYRNDVAPAMATATAPSNPAPAQVAPEIPGLNTVPPPQFVRLVGPGARQAVVYDPSAATDDELTVTMAPTDLQPVVAKQAPSASAPVAQSIAPPGATIGYVYIPGGQTGSRGQRQNNSGPTTTTTSGNRRGNATVTTANPPAPPQPTPITTTIVTGQRNPPAPITTRIPTGLPAR